MVDRLRTVVMPYAWGSRTAIAELTGRASPTSSPEAELWMGAHPMAPSRVSRGGEEQSLAEIIAQCPARELGAEVVGSYGARLPFLLKVLAAAQPLSLQAHPDSERAKIGFDDENRRGIPKDATVRSYRDSSHKPELLCALGPVDALCGFRRIADTLRLVGELGVKQLNAHLAPLRASPNSAGLANVFSTLMTLAPAEAAPLAHATASAAAGLVAAQGPKTRTRASMFLREYAWVVRLNELYPGDIGVVSALLLNLVHLEVGEALYLGPGNLHAYLDGVGIEIMASSDNVLRGGLTKKHVDVAELVRVLDFAAGPASPIVARERGDHERVWDTPAHEFQLSAIDLLPGESVRRNVRGPEILMCSAGDATIFPDDGTKAVALERGSSAFVPASTARYEVRNESEKGNPMCLYRATVNFT